jgi:hypothetical protein
VPFLFSEGIKVNKNKIIFGKDHFYEMTPKKILIIADAIKGTCAVAAGYSLVSDNKTLSIVTLVLVIGCELVQRLFGIKR